MLGLFGFGSREKPQITENEEDKDEGITLKEFLEKQRELELEAGAALPFKFDQCSAQLGPLRQNLHICHNCPNNSDGSKDRPLAFCYACAITCHEFDPEKTGFNAEVAGIVTKSDGYEEDVFDAYVVDGSTGTSSSNRHSIEEIWARRNFMCDCHASGHCKLLKSIPEEFSNHQNSYLNEHNFKGKYCICNGAGWSVGDRTMYQCEICEDWFHDDCVASDSNGEIPLEDSFNDFICKTCVKDNLEFFSQFDFNDNFHIFSSSANTKLPVPLFLVSGWRDFFKTVTIEEDLSVPSGLGHLLRDEEVVYEPPLDNDASESLYDLGLKALEQCAPRDQAIQGIKMIDSLKDRLKTRLESIATNEKRAITSTDISAFFEEENLSKKRSKFDSN